MPEDPRDLAVVHNEDLHRFELRLRHDIAAWSAYRREPEGIVLRYSHLRPGYEGRQLGPVLAAGVLNAIQQHNVTVARVSCPLLGTYIADHPEYASLASTTGSW